MAYWLGAHQLHGVAIARLGKLATAIHVVPHGRVRVKDIDIVVVFEFPRSDVGVAAEHNELRLHLQERCPS